MDPLFDFTGKVVLVTGGSRGLGRADGARVRRTRRRRGDREPQVAVVRRSGARSREEGPQGVAVSRVTWVAGTKSASSRTRHTNDSASVDVLINNAGMSPLYPSLEDISEELFDKVVGLNFKGPFRLSALVGSRMAKGDGGSIINISSTASLNPSPTSEPYGAAKAGLNSITRSFAFAYGPKVRVNCIVAGPFLTDISKAWDMEAFANSGAAARAETRRRAERNRRRGAVSGESVGEFHDRHAGSRRRWDAVAAARASAPRDRRDDARREIFAGQSFDRLEAAGIGEIEFDDPRIRDVDRDEVNAVRRATAAPRRSRVPISSGDSATVSARPSSVRLTRWSAPGRRRYAPMTSPSASNTRVSPRSISAM